MKAEGGSHFPKEKFSSFRLHPSSFGSGTGFAKSDAVTRNALPCKVPSEAGVKQAKREEPVSFLNWASPLAFCGGHGSV
jgi:hypothetical protein